jgi:hypothetical protein
MNYSNMALYLNSIVSDYLMVLLNENKLHYFFYSVFFNDFPFI